MGIDGNAIALGIVIVAGVVGWGLIELVLWLTSHISLSWI
jgi:hypothetical protein